MKKQILVPCDCGCSILSIDTDEDNYVIISHFYTSWYEKQNTIRDEIITRLKMIWFILIGKRYSLYDIVLEKEHFIELKNKINEVNFGEE